MNADRPTEHDRDVDREDSPADRFATLRAHLALAGCTLARAAEGYYLITRWHVSRQLATLEQVEQVRRGIAS